MKHALSFDIEDWFHIVDIPELEDISTWDKRVTLAEEKTDLILSILEDVGVKATFFVLGWVANKYPNISKKIVSAGHELGTHSYWHRRVYELRPEIFLKDLKKSISVLEDQSGRKVKGFRAPSFSIIPGTEWAFDVIIEAGLSYDASLFPSKRGHGGYPCKQEIHTIKTKSGDLVELPMSIGKVLNQNLPFSGGGYMRLLPYWYIQSQIKSFEKKNTPAVVYLHPRDFAPECPRVSMPVHRRFKSYVGLSTTEKKLRRLLRDFQFGSCEEIIKSSSFHI